MWYNHLVCLKFNLFINLLIIANVYCGYIGPNQRTNLNRGGNAYHRGYIHSDSKLEPPSRPSFNWDDPQFRPYFDDIHPLNITSQLGKTAYLQCAIRQLGDRTVSWVRQRDLHILTVGSYTYTSDQRFSCIHREETGSWTLEIKHVVKEDQGVYECQISTEPKLSLAVRLIVQATKAIIPEGPLIKLAPKSFLKLSCLLELNYQTRKNLPSFVFWYKDGEVINYLSGRSELRVVSNFIDGHHFYNRSSNAHQYNTNSNQNLDRNLDRSLDQNLDRNQLNFQQKNSFIHSTHHQSLPYLPNNKYSPSSTYGHQLDFQKSSSDFPLSYVGQLNEDENQFDDELFERDDQIRNKEIIISILTIDGVKPSDSGNYACKPSYAEFANCTIQVLKDESIYRGGGPMSSSTHQQTNTIYPNGNFEEETKSIEFFDDEEESFYIRSPSKIMPSNASSNSFFSHFIWKWISLSTGQLYIFYNLCKNL